MIRTKLFNSYGVDEEINDWCDIMANRKDLYWGGIIDIIAIPKYSGVSDVLVTYNFEKVKKDENGTV